jgi:SPP1 gp7 family putative phage head morphogenesis protein
MTSNPQDKSILSEETLLADRLKIEQKFKATLPRELLNNLKGAESLAVARIIKKITADNCWGLWLAGMEHGRDHALLELKMVGQKSAKFSLVAENPPSRIQNKQAEKAIWTRSNVLAGNVADTEWLRIQAAIKENVRGDTSRVELQAAITDTLGGERFKGRSESIARTELTFAYNAGRIETYRENNVEAIRRYCLRDERTCQQCADLNGSVARLDDMAAVMRLQPPSHVNCLIPSTLISTGSVKATSQRHYNGEVIRIQTASGNVLTVTPNHPILTPQGWVAANLLNEGSDVISGASLERIASVITPNDYQCNTAIEEIVTAFNEANRSTSVSMETAPEDFHTDGQGSKIHVINTDRLLRNEVKTSVFNEFNKLDLVSAFVAKPIRLNADRPINQKLPSLVSPSIRSMSLGDLGGSGFSSHLCPFHFFRSRLAPAFGATILKDSFHRSSLDSEFLSTAVLGQAPQISSDCVIPDRFMSFPEHLSNLDFSILTSLPFVSEEAPIYQDLSQSNVANMSQAASIFERFARNIKLDPIIKISRFHYDGFVYNIETDTGWYFASNIITHNCRCTVSPLLDIQQLAENNRKPPPLQREPWLMGRIVAAIIG